MRILIILCPEYLSLKTGNVTDLFFYFSNLLFFLFKLTYAHSHILSFDEKTPLVTIHPNVMARTRNVTTIA